MPVSVTCPSCGVKLKAPDNAAGKKLACSKCRSPIAIPAANQIAESPAPGALVPAKATAASPVTATKACPFCSETVLATAKKCKHCGETIDVALRAAEESERAARGSGRRRQEDDDEDDAPGRAKARPGAAAAAASTTVIVHTGEEKAKFPHFLHFALTVVTCGLWGPIWLIHAMIRAR